MDCAADDSDHDDTQSESANREHHAKAAELFRLADLNQDDVLTKNEMKKFARTDEGAPLRELFDVERAGWSGVWAAIDTNGDREFSKQEFVAAYVAAATTGELD